jgi:hypothetical protein
MWESCRAAQALQTGDPDWLDLTSIGSDLQRGIATWNKLPGPIRKPTLALVELQT